MKKLISGLCVLLAACSEDAVLTYEQQLNKDVAIIDKYLVDNNVQNVVQDPSGLRLTITKTGTGPSPTLSNNVTVRYTGRFLSDGKIFDQSANPVSFNLSGLIQGWQIGFQYLQAGSKAILYIPSGLCYGPQGTSGIPGNSNLYFDVELVSFK